MQPVEEVAAATVAGTELAHGWVLHALTDGAQEALREPVAAVPESLAGLLGPVHVYAAPFLACQEGRDLVCSESPAGECHSSLWLERPDGLHLFISFGDTNPHDAGFELLAALGELLAPRLSDQVFARYAQLLARELREGACGEIDEEALEAKEAAGEDYTTVSLASTLAEYMHSLWHDVELRQGPEHLAGAFLRRRFELLAECFPPNAGFVLFR